MPEIWRPIWSFEGWYDVSDQGRVKRLGGTPFCPTERVLKAIPDKDGYLNVSLWKEGKEKRFKVHRLVAEAFLGSCPDGIQVNHINLIKTDNRLCNLEYVTPEENVHHAIKNGLHPVGSRHVHAKLTESQVIEIRSALIRGVYQEELAKRFGVSPSLVSMIARRKRWKHVS